MARCVETLGRDGLIENQRTRFVHTRALALARAVINRVSLALRGASMSWKSKRFQHVKNTLTCNLRQHVNTHTIKTRRPDPHTSTNVNRQSIQQLEQISTHLPTDSARQILNN